MEIVKELLIKAKSIWDSICGTVSITSNILSSPQSILYVVAIVGFFFIMGGNKKWGTRLTSLGIIGTIIINILGGM